MATIQLNRSATGVAPTSLAPGEIYLDELNGRLYWADNTGAVHYTALLPVAITAAQMPALTGDVTTPGGSLATTIAAGVVTLAKIATAAVATTAQFLSNVASTLLTTDQVWGAAAPVGLTDAATISVDMSTFINAYVTLAGNRTLGNPANTKPGQSGSIFIFQDATGSRTLTLSSNWRTPGGSGAWPGLSTYANAVDRLDYVVFNSGNIHYVLSKGIY